jgi:hypothetical protein
VFLSSICIFHRPDLDHLGFRRLATQYRYGFTNQIKEGAEKSKDINSGGSKTGSTTGTTTGSTTGTTTGTTTGDDSGNSTGATTGSSDGNTTGNVPTSPGGPIAGIEAWQDGHIVTSIATGKVVFFKLTKWTHDTSVTTGCTENVGIVQSSWTIGTRPQVDIQRFAGQDCRSFDYSGTFTKPGTIAVTLDVLTGEGETAHAEATYSVTGGVVVGPVAPSPAPSPSSSPSAPSKTPTQK